ncbi:MAG TPA: DUF4893 domain-containing protein, partial [Caulobacteraceae bacterium]
APAPARPSAPAPARPAAPAPAQAPAREPQASDQWTDYAKPKDADRLARLDAAWQAGLEGARAMDDPDVRNAMAVLGPVVDPDARVLAHPHPAPGDYRCRTLKLGGMAGFISYPWFKCRIDLTPGGDLTFEKLTGSQRGAGKFYPRDETSLVYLGGQAWGLDEEKASAYGAIPERDQIGVLERIGDTRWRLVLPWPRVESDLDVVEISK